MLLASGFRVRREFRLPDRPTSAFSDSVRLMVVNAQVVVADKISERRAKTEPQKVVTKLLVVNAELYCDTQVYVSSLYTDASIGSWLKARKESCIISS